MFFMIGINDGRREFDFSQLTICDACGAYGRLTVFMTYTALFLYLIPCFKWNRKYWVKSSCCDVVYALDPEIGARIARGEQVEILPEHMSRVYDGEGELRRCANCGYGTREDFGFCPKCGRKF